MLPLGFTFWRGEQTKLAYQIVQRLERITQKMAQHFGSSLERNPFKSSLGSIDRSEVYYNISFKKTRVRGNPRWIEEFINPILSHSDSGFGRVFHLLYWIFGDL